MAMQNADPHTPANQDLDIQLDVLLDHTPGPTPESTSLLANASTHQDRPSSIPRAVTNSELAPIRRVTLVSVALSILQLSLLSTFVGYVWSHRVVQRDAIIWVSIPNNLFLLMSTVISRVPPVIVPIAMSIAAYGFAKDWLSSSSLPEHPGNPTPKQYQIALQVNGNADIGAAWATSKYLLTRSSKSRHPAWLTKSIAALFSLLSLAYLNGFLDIWLHQAVSVATLTFFTKAPQPLTTFSRLLNPRLCDGPPDMVNVNCSLFHTAYNPDESIDTAAGRSGTHEVVLLPNTATALLLPAASIRGQMTYEASTFAAYSTCAPISRQCNLASFANAGRVGIQFFCFGRPAFQGSLDIDREFSHSYVFNGSGRVTPRDFGDWSDFGAWSQPVELGIVADFPYSDHGPVVNPDYQLFYVDSQAGRRPVYVILLWCEWSILNVTYRVQPHRDTSPELLQYQLANPRDTFALSSPIYAGSCICTIRHLSFSRNLRQMVRSITCYSPRYRLLTRSLASTLTLGHLHSPETCPISHSLTLLP